MRGTVAKRIRRQALQKGHYIENQKKYVQRKENGGITQAFLGRVVSIFNGHRKPIRKEVYVSKNSATISVNPLHVRAIYRKLKKAYRRGGVKI